MNKHISTASAHRSCYKARVNFCLIDTKCFMQVCAASQKSLAGLDSTQADGVGAIAALENITNTLQKHGEIQSFNQFEMSCQKYNKQTSQQATSRRVKKQTYNKHIPNITNITNKQI